jgi:hypothetical protein
MLTRLRRESLPPAGSFRITGTVVSKILPWLIGPPEIMEKTRAS